MKSLIILFICILIFLPACSAHTSEGNTIQSLAVTGGAESSVETLSQINNDLSLSDRFKLISFTLEDGYYTRNVLQDGTEFVEMFVLDKDSFVRISSEENEQEVFSFNYNTTEFTYMYYIADEKAVKVIYNIGEDKIVEDEDDFIELVKADATALERYFESLIEEAGIDINEL